MKMLNQREFGQVLFLYMNLLNMKVILELIKV